jgi:RsiW-degrading membrane proteinase PrsW (M82 family)
MKSSHSHDKNSQYRLPLGEEVSHLEQEARMILPGIQAVFGFQLMAVFNNGFGQLSHEEKLLHLASLLLVVISGILVAAPAAYHRQAHHRVSEHFMLIGTRFLTLALFPLALGTSLDIYLVTRVITESPGTATLLSILLFLFYASVWFVYPQIRGRKIKKMPVKELSEK